MIVIIVKVICIVELLLFNDIFNGNIKLVICLFKFNFVFVFFKVIGKVIVEEVVVKVIIDIFFMFVIKCSGFIL